MILSLIAACNNMTKLGGNKCEDCEVKEIYLLNFSFLL